MMFVIGCGCIVLAILLYLYAASRKFNEWTAWTIFIFSVIGLLAIIGSFATLAWRYLP